MRAQAAVTSSPGTDVAGVWITGTRHQRHTTNSSAAAAAAAEGGGGGSGAVCCFVIATGNTDRPPPLTYVYVLCPTLDLRASNGCPFKR